MLVDDHPLLRRGMRVLIEQAFAIRGMREADNAPEAVDLVRRLKPDLTIVDITLKSTNGIELTKVTAGPGAGNADPGGFNARRGGLCRTCAARRGRWAT